MITNKLNLSSIFHIFTGLVNTVIVKPSLISLQVNSKDLVSLVRIFKNSIFLNFYSLLDIVVLDYPYKAKRFLLNYVFLSHKLGTRLIIKFSVTAFESIASVTSYYNAATWLEREVWDMFGIFFFNNFDLRRILTDYGFIGHPLRKDFPLMGYFELRYDDSLKRVVYEPLEASQEFRFFYFSTPWESNYS